MASPPHSKISDLNAGSLGAIQVSLTTEVPTVRHMMLNANPIITPLEGLNGAKLGYGQVLFTTEEALGDGRQQVVSAFLEATFKGWEIAIREPPEAAKMVGRNQTHVGIGR